MECITSRGFRLPESADELADGYWFNLWRYKLWPYRELVVGDILYWYESPSQCIVWKTRVADVDRFCYDSKEAVRNWLEARFGSLDAAQPYFVESAEEGYCLAWEVIALQKMSLHKPDGFRFPQQGWLRVNDDIASGWLKQPGIADDVTLDDIAPSGTLLERINQLNDVLANVSRKRVHSVVERTVRRDTQLVRALKEFCEFRCQFPGCEVRIPKRDGGFYIEVAHIQAVSEGGPSTVGNLLVLCPNHHKEFDYGDLEIVEQTADAICGKLNGKEFEIRLPGADAITQTREFDHQGEPSV
jgi:hypothetical protein